MNISFIVNSLYHSPESFHRKVFSKLLIPPSHDIEFLFTEHKSHATDLAEHAVKAGSDLLIACGGDGTLHEVINGFMNVNPETKKSNVGFFPIGTGNDFSRNFNFTGSLKDLNTRLISINYQNIDLGRFTDIEGRTRYFHNEISFGFGAAVIRQTENESKSKNKSYLNTIIKSFKSFKSTLVKVEGDEFIWEGKAFLIVVANGKYMGGGLSLAPEAITHDGLFNVTIVGEVTMWDFVKRLPSILRAKPLNHPQIFYFESSNLDIIADDPGFAAEADGELMHSLPRQISCLPTIISFLS